MENRYSETIATELATIYVKIFGVAISSFMLIEATNTIEKIVSVTLILAFALYKNNITLIKGENK